MWDEYESDTYSNEIEKTGSPEKKQIQQEWNMTNAYHYMIFAAYCGWKRMPFTTGRQTCLQEKKEG
jgi:hypothetical protein